MRVKTTITLSEDVLRAMTKRAKRYKDRYKSRSMFIEAAVWAFISQTIREDQKARDLEIMALPTLTGK